MRIQDVTGNFSGLEKNVEPIKFYVTLNFSAFGVIIRKRIGRENVIQ